MRPVLLSGLYVIFRAANQQQQGTQRPSTQPLLFTVLSLFSSTCAVNSGFTLLETAVTRYSYLQRFLYYVPLFVLYLLASNAYVIYIDSVTVDDVCHIVNKNFACKSGGFLFTVSLNFNLDHNSHFKRSEGTDSSK